jgi:hypothetical protein
VAGQGTERLRAGNTRPLGLAAEATVNLYRLLEMERQCGERTEKSQAVIVSAEVAKVQVRAAGFHLRTGPGRFGRAGTASFGSATSGG